ncbi:hypothetical protein [Shewanella surugensis]|uniref:Uncharacterized protein n=1 Tax=Shewanella surugensis TaxID=212020 RepID=A0ABT0LJQ6_9GAMM|nr:hypothetical protein [Shewanella surugensis]MCL1127913.1 hypothetical protein [Shewanella surugensis]
MNYLNIAENGSKFSGEIFYQTHFIVITNNYRAFSGQFPGTGPKHVVLSFPDDIQALLSNNITQQTKKKGNIDIIPTYNWRLKPIKTRTKLDIRFQTQNTAAAEHFIMDHQKLKMINKGEDPQGYANYQLLLDQH